MQIISNIRIDIGISYSSIQKCYYLLFIFNIKRNWYLVLKVGKNNRCFKILILVVFRSFHIFVKNLSIVALVGLGMEPILLIVVISLIAIFFSIPPLMQPCLYSIFQKHKNSYTQQVRWASTKCMQSTLTVQLTDLLLIRVRKYYELNIVIMIMQFYQSQFFNELQKRAM